MEKGFIGFVGSKEAAKLLGLKEPLFHYYRYRTLVPESRLSPTFTESHRHYFSLQDLKAFRDRVLKDKAVLPIDEMVVTGQKDEPTSITVNES